MIIIYIFKNKEIINMIGVKEIECMKKGVILINCVRGGFYDEDVFYEVLEIKKVCWFGIDVFFKEFGIYNKFLDLFNVYVILYIGVNILEF